MRVKELKALIDGKLDDENVIVFVMDKSEANDHIWNYFPDGTSAPAITDEEWMQVFLNVQPNKTIWQELTESFNYEMGKIEKAREAK
jgi:hypothetical protein